MKKFYADLDLYTNSFGVIHKNIFSQFIDDVKKKRPHLKKIRFELNPKLPESKDQRKFFEGGICTLFAYHHEALDHRDWKDVKIAREWLKQEFNSEYVEFMGRANKVEKSTKDNLTEVLDQITEWFIENGMAGVNNIAINTEEYQKWRDEIFPFGGADNWCDYLESINKLRRVKYEKYTD